MCTQYSVARSSAHTTTFILQWTINTTHSHFTQTPIFHTNDVHSNNHFSRSVYVSIISMKTKLIQLQHSTMAAEKKNHFQCNLILTMKNYRKSFFREKIGKLHFLD